MIRPSWYWVSVSADLGDRLGQDLRLLVGDDHVVQRNRDAGLGRHPEPERHDASANSTVFFATGDAVAPVDQVAESLLATSDDSTRLNGSSDGHDAVEQHAADRGLDELALRLDHVRVGVGGPDRDLVLEPEEACGREDQRERVLELAAQVLQRRPSPGSAGTAVLNRASIRALAVLVDLAIGLSDADRAARAARISGSSYAHIRMPPTVNSLAPSILPPADGIAKPSVSET